MTSNQIAERFAAQVERNRQRGQENRDFVEMIVKESGQPVTNNEVRALLHELTGRLLDSVYVRRILDTLVSEGKIVARPETAAERRVRAGGVQPRGSLGKLYMKTGTPMTRTQEIVVPGVSLRHSVNYTGVYVGRYKTEPAKKKSKKKNSGLVRKTQAQTGTISDMIEVLVAERTRVLQARIDELEKMLTGIKKIVS